jgi:hypothetical protein
MFNIIMSLSQDGKTLSLTMAANASGKDSTTGKSRVIASTEGNIQVPGTDLTLGLNLYRRK